ncbi:hypothetical protein GCM10010124_25810 [Pilimelia terevasa]|uniref:Uncharacterized protein n=1 Tax=Pilimelia terevasa TaxID=53372 RepID=A0A8J3FI37_9ACTN|nr:hypothetical protein GCM10010124_25810 [Pilimelia terevasa]
MRHLTRRERAWLVQRLCPNREPFPPPLPEQVEGQPAGGRRVPAQWMGSGR